MKNNLLIERPLWFVNDIKKTEVVEVLLRVGSSGKTKEITFRPSEDLKKGDEVKITAEKV